MLTEQLPWTVVLRCMEQFLIATAEQNQSASPLSGWGGVIFLQYFTGPKQKL